jgi:LPPG:FO 2-phospho-L-lactate transferase
VVLAGGTGGAKLARGMLGVVGAERLVVIANPGDDIEIYGGYVSPDPDLVSFWLADRIHPRGWGLAGDTFTVMDALRELGREIWFNLGDRNLAWCLERARLLAGGCRATEALAQLQAHIGVRARVLPACDEPLRTFVNGIPLQEFLICRRGADPVESLTFEGVERARPTPAVLAALATAAAVVIGPSNPSISIGPILALPGMREALADAPGPVVAVSPIVGGKVLKGPTAAFLAHAGQPMSAAGVAALYAGLLDGMVADEPLEGLPTLRLDTLMSDAAQRREVAAQVLRFAEALGT